MELSLENQVVFISGSSRGIGLATAEAFLREKACVILNGRDDSRLEGERERLSSNYPNRVYTATGDATTTSGIQEIMEQIRNCTSQIDVFIANLGSGKPEDPDRLNIKEWRRFYEINVVANIALLKEMRPLLNKGEGKSIVFLSSIVAREKMSAPYGYAAAKSAIIILTKNLAKDLATDGFRVNCVLPGNIFFPGGRWEELRNQDQKGVDTYIKTEVPMRRFGKPEEIADAILFLSSKRAGFITGASLVVDGGQLSVF